MKIFKIILIFIIVIAIITSGYIFYNYTTPQKDTKKPLKIGVLLPLTGPNATDWGDVLDWAIENINEIGGIDGRRIELVYKDTNEEDILQLAKEFVDDPSVNIVIGPSNSDDVYKITPMFIRNKKILISPSSTAGEVYETFGGKDFFWRTCQSDVAQIKTIFHVLSQRNVTNVSLIYEDTIYGKTFFDWTGFYSIESDIKLLNLVKLELGASDFSEVVKQALEGEPEYIICVAFASDAVKIKMELDEWGSATKLFFTDAAETQYLIDELGKAAEGLEGTSPAADPSAGFETAYFKKFGQEPSAYSAPTYDAFLLAIYSLARYEYKNGVEGIEESIKKIVSGKGTEVGWDKEGMKNAIDLILQGEFPDVAGTSGPLEFDEEFGVDPLETFYIHWKVESGNFRAIETISSTPAF